MNLSAVILAGGESRRMGRDKAWVELDGQPLIKLALAKIRRLGVEEIFISGRPGEDYSGLKCPVLTDLEPGYGPLGGIERALCSCTTPLLLVLAVDLPHMTSGYLERLARQCEPWVGVVPQRDGGLEPLAAIYPQRCHAILRDFIAQSRRVARDFAEACLRAGAVKTWPVPKGEADCFTNWNQPGDMARPGQRPKNLATKKETL